MLRAAARTPSPSPASGGHLVALDGRPLPLRKAALRADARGGLARVTLEQTFHNPFPEPLEVTYQLPLPADGAVSGFAFSFAGERVVGEVDRVQRARERFEEALLEGRTAALLEQQRSSLFTQRVGNVPPGAEVVCEVQVDQPLAFLPDGAWEWRFPTVVAPRYLGAPGTVPDAAAVSVPVADGAPAVEVSLALAIRDPLAEGERPHSPSHALHGERLPGRVQVTLADPAAARLDRDLVVRWRAAALEPGLSLDLVERGGRTFGLVTLVPPAPEARAPALPRDLVVLLDTSGSMGGQPLDQARRLTSALVDSLGDADSLELIEFSSEPRRWKKAAVKATSANRAEAQRWLARLQASGGTEMHTGILEALSPLREGAQRQVVLVTDGLIGFERQVVEAVATRLPAGSRVHAVGVGSGVNRSLTRPVARAGRGLELVLGLGEDVEPAVTRLLARTVAPLLTELEVVGSGVRAVAPRRLPDVYAGAPALFAVELVPGATVLAVRAEGPGGRFEGTARAPGVEGSGAVAALFGREQVEDLELQLAAGEAGSVDAAIERVGLELQLATRLTAWVAVSDRATVDPRAPGRKETVPQALPYGLSAEGLGLRSAASGPRGMRLGMRLGAFSGPPPAPMASAAAPRRSEKAKGGRDLSWAPRSVEDAEDDELAEGGVSPSFREAPPEPEQEARSAFAAPRVLPARVVRRGAGELVLEVTVDDEGLAWAPGEEVEVVLPDGRSLTVKVLEARTTAPGAYQAGLTLRLGLALDLASEVPERVRLPGGLLLEVG